MGISCCGLTNSQICPLAYSQVSWGIGILSLGYVISDGPAPVDWVLSLVSVLTWNETHTQFCTRSHSGSPGNAVDTERSKNICQEQPYPRPHLAAVRVLRHTSQSASYAHHAASRSRSLYPSEVSDLARVYKSLQGSTFDAVAVSHELYLRVQSRLPP